MTNPLNLKALVLNANGAPLSTFPPSLISSTTAVTAVWRERAIVVEEWPDAFFRSPSTKIAVPKTLMLRDFANVTSKPKFSRRTIFLRDRFCCQYCGERFETKDLTYDHVIPRSRGGRTEWQNIVTACIGCNSAKASSLPNFSGRKGSVGKDGSMRPLKDPRQPSNAELIRAGLELIPNDIRETWCDYLYWHAELERG